MTALQQLHSWLHGRLLVRLRFHQGAHSCYCQLAQLRGCEAAHAWAIPWQCRCLCAVECECCNAQALPKLGMSVGAQPVGDILCNLWALQITAVGTAIHSKVALCLSRQHSRPLSTARVYMPETVMLHGTIDLSFRNMPYTAHVFAIYPSAYMVPCIGAAYMVPCIAFAYMAP